MRRILLIASFVFAATAGARVTFVAPLEGAQVIGPQAIEITTDLQSVDRVDFSIDGAMAGVARKAPFRIAYDFGSTLTARTITATVWSNGFKTSEHASITTAAMSIGDTLDVDVVEVPLRVRSDRPIQPADLRVRENGIEQTVREVRMERPPAHFAFVVDRSLSMGEGKLEAALDAIRQELRQLRTGDTSSLVLFNHRVDRPREVRQAPRELAPSGGTSLRDAIASIASKERTYAIVITDGGDRNSELSEEAALRKISGTRTVVSALVLGDSHARFLDRAAANTGGTIVSASRDTVRSELRRVLVDINSRHLLVYQSQGTRRGWRTIDVESRRRDLAVLGARKGYFAE